MTPPARPFPDPPDPTAWAARVIAERGTPPTRLVALVADLLGPTTPARKSA